MKKICKICGKSRCMFPWEDICYTCRPKKDLTEIQQRIKDNQEDVDTFSSNYIICPYCGNALDTEYGYEDFPELTSNHRANVHCKNIVSQCQ